MTVLFLDSFDHYVTADFSAKYAATNTPGISVGNGRNGTNAFSSAGGNRQLTTKSFKNSTTLITNIAYYPTAALANNFFFYFMDAGTVQCSLYQYSDGRLEARRSTSTSLEQSVPSVINSGQWNFVEIKITINNSSGIFIVKVNNTTVINFSGGDTQQTANAYINYDIFNTPQACYADDFSILDTEGSIANDFIGDSRVSVLLPSSSGTYAQWQVTGTSSHYLAVDDANPDTTTYTYATGSSLRDTFSIDDLSASDGTIYGIQTLLYARKDDAGVVTIDPVARIGGTDYTLGTGSFSLSDSYSYYWSIEEVNPDTSGSWSFSDINNLEFGYNRNS